MKYHFPFLSTGTWACIRVVARAALIASPWVCTRSPRMSSLSSPGRCFKWVCPSWTKRMGNTTKELQVKLSLATTSTVCELLFVSCNPLIITVHLTFLVMAGLLVCFSQGWSWSDFLPLKELQDLSRGYLIESNCVVKADLTIFGSSSDG